MSFESTPIAGMTRRTGTDLAMGLPAAAASETTGDMTLLPAAPAVGDAFYFGGRRPLSGVAWSVSTAGVGDWVLVYEFWNGSAWAVITGYSDGSSGFRIPGETEIRFGFTPASVQTALRRTAVPAIGLAESS